MATSTVYLTVCSSGGLKLEVTCVPVAFHISLVSDFASEGNGLKLIDKTLT